jgi:hypothetical protein
MFQAIKKGFEFLFQLLIDLFTWILEGIMEVLKPVIDIFIGIGYFIYKIGVVLVEIVFLLGSVGRLVLALIQGLFNTLTSFDFDGTPASLPGSVGQAFNNLQPIFETLQFNKIGFVVMFSIWLFTALAAIKIVQTFRGGNDS